MKIGISLVTFNSEKDIAQCLDSLLLQTKKADLIYVYDNASSDDTLEILKKYPVITLISGPKNLGLSKATNILWAELRKQKCDVIGWLNPDTVADSNLIEEVLATMKNCNASIVQPLILFPDHKKINTRGNTFSYVGITTCLGIGEKIYPEKDQEILIASGACLFLNELQYKTPILLDEHFFMYHEDTDLSLRTHLLGGKIVLSHKAIITHNYIERFSAYKMYYLERNRFLLLCTYYPLLLFIALLPVFFIFECGMLFYSILHGYFFEKLKAYWSFFNSFSYIIQKRRELKKIQKISPRDFFCMLDKKITSSQVPGIYVRVSSFILRNYAKLILFFWR